MMTWITQWTSKFELKPGLRPERKPAARTLALLAVPLLLGSCNWVMDVSASDPAPPKPLLVKEYTAGSLESGASSGTSTSPAIASIFERCEIYPGEVRWTRMIGPITVSEQTALRSTEGLASVIALSSDGPIPSNVVNSAWRELGTTTYRANQINSETGAVTEVVLATSGPMSALNMSDSSLSLTGFVDSICRTNGLIPSSEDVESDEDSDPFQSETDRASMIHPFSWSEFISTIQVCTADTPASCLSSGGYRCRMTTPPTCTGPSGDPIAIADAPGMPSSGGGGSTGDSGTVIGGGGTSTGSTGGTTTASGPIQVLPPEASLMPIPGRTSLGALVSCSDPNSTGSSTSAPNPITAPVLPPTWLDKATQAPIVSRLPSSVNYAFARSRTPSEALLSAKAIQSMLSSFTIPNAYADGTSTNDSPLLSSWVTDSAQSWRNRQDLYNYWSKHIQQPFYAWMAENYLQSVSAQYLGFYAPTDVAEFRTDDSSYSCYRNSASKPLPPYVHPGMISAEAQASDGVWETAVRYLREKYAEWSRELPYIVVKNPTAYGACIGYVRGPGRVGAPVVLASDPVYVPAKGTATIPFNSFVVDVKEPIDEISLAVTDCHPRNPTALRLVRFALPKVGSSGPGSGYVATPAPAAPIIGGGSSSCPSSGGGSCPAGMSMVADSCGIPSCQCPKGTHPEIKDKATGDSLVKRVGDQFDSASGTYPTGSMSPAERAIAQVMEGQRGYVTNPNLSCLSKKLEVAWDNASAALGGECKPTSTDSMKDVDISCVPNTCPGNAILMDDGKTCDCPLDPTTGKKMEWNDVLKSCIPRPQQPAPEDPNKCPDDMELAQTPDAEPNQPAANPNACPPVSAPIKAARKGVCVCKDKSMIPGPNGCMTLGCPTGYVPQGFATLLADGSIQPPACACEMRADGTVLKPLFFKDPLSNKCRNLCCDPSKEKPHPQSGDECVDKCFGVVDGATYDPAAGSGSNACACPALHYKAGNSEKLRCVPEPQCLASQFVDWEVKDGDHHKVCKDKCKEGWSFELDPSVPFSPGFCVCKSPNIVKDDGSCGRPPECPVFPSPNPSGSPGDPCAPNGGADAQQTPEVPTGSAFDASITLDAAPGFTDQLTQSLVSAANPGETLGTPPPPPNTGDPNLTNVPPMSAPAGSNDSGSGSGSGGSGGGSGGSTGGAGSGSGTATGEGTSSASQAEAVEQARKQDPVVPRASQMGHPMTEMAAQPSGNAGPPKSFEDIVHEDGSLNQKWEEVRQAQRDFSARTQTKGLFNRGGENSSAKAGWWYNVFKPISKNLPFLNKLDDDTHKLEEAQKTYEKKLDKFKRNFREHARQAGWSEAQIADLEAQLDRWKWKTEKFVTRQAQKAEENMTEGYAAGETVGRIGAALIGGAALPGLAVGTFGKIGVAAAITYFDVLALKYMETAIKSGVAGPDGKLPPLSKLLEEDRQKNHVEALKAGAVVAAIMSGSEFVAILARATTASKVISELINKTGFQNIIAGLANAQNLEVGMLEALGAHIALESLNQIGEGVDEIEKGHANNGWAKIETALLNFGFSSKIIASIKGMLVSSGKLTPESITTRPDENLPADPQPREPTDFELQRDEAIEVVGHAETDPNLSTSKAVDIGVTIAKMAEHGFSPTQKKVWDWLQNGSGRNVKIVIGEGESKFDPVKNEIHVNSNQSAESIIGDLLAEGHRAMEHAAEPPADPAHPLNETQKHADEATKELHEEMARNGDDAQKAWEAAKAHDPWLAELETLMPEMATMTPAEKLAFVERLEVMIQIDGLAANNFINWLKRRQARANGDPDADTKFPVDPAFDGQAFVDEHVGKAKADAAGTSGSSTMNGPNGRPRIMEKDLGGTLGKGGNDAQVFTNPLNPNEVVRIPHGNGSAAPTLENAQGVFNRLSEIKGAHDAINAERQAAGKPPLEMRIVKPSAIVEIVKRDGSIVYGVTMEKLPRIARDTVMDAQGNLVNTKEALDLNRDMYRASTEMIDAFAQKGYVLRDFKSDNIGLDAQGKLVFFDVHLSKTPEQILEEAGNDPDKAKEYLDQLVEVEKQTADWIFSNRSDEPPPPSNGGGTPPAGDLPPEPPKEKLNKSDLTFKLGEGDEAITYMHPTRASDAVRVLKVEPTAENATKEFRKLEELNSKVDEINSERTAQGKAPLGIRFAKPVSVAELRALQGIEYGLVREGVFTTTNQDLKTIESRSGTGTARETGKQLYAEAQEVVSELAKKGYAVVDLNPNNMGTKYGPKIFFDATRVLTPAEVDALAKSEGMTFEQKMEQLQNRIKDEMFRQWSYWIL